MFGSVSTNKMYVHLQYMYMFCLCPVLTCLMRAQILHLSKRAKKKQLASDSAQDEELTNQEENPQKIIDVPRLNVQYYRSPNPL